MDCLGAMNVSTRFCANPSCRYWAFWKPTIGARGKSLGVTKLIKLHRLGTVKVCTKCHGNPSSCCCWDISVWTKVVDGLNNWQADAACMAKNRNRSAINCFHPFLTKSQWGTLDGHLAHCLANYSCTLIVPQKWGPHKIFLRTPCNLKAVYNN